MRTCPEEDAGSELFGRELRAPHETEPAEVDHGELAGVLTSMILGLQQEVMV